jgi:DNA helicase IV
MAVQEEDLRAEQAYIDEAYRCLDRMRERTAGLELQAGNEVSQKDLELMMARRLASLSDTGRPLCFGRIDTEDDERWYIGRRHVEDDAADPVVVEWRAPVAEPYYRAKATDRLGLTRRRQFLLDGHRLLSIADDRFGEDEPADNVRGRQALIAELERSRAGEMVDIVSTIQPEQDELIRSPLEGLMAVQGGPGSGKTAVGLHRAAFLLYSHPELVRSNVLVIGPNRQFLRYIAAVLPSLGEEAVVQTTLRDLYGRIRITVVDDEATQRAKGDVAMVGVIADALAARRRPLEDDVVVTVGLTRLRVAAERANAMAESIAARGGPYNAGRAGLRNQLSRALLHTYGGGMSDAAAVVRRDPRFTAALDRLWPTASPAAVVKDVVDAARGWTEADIPLLDEAHDQLSGQARTFGHVVVDEAQDLSPMSLRMLGRRCPSGSMTILGDLAQGTGVWAHDRWEDVLAHLPAPAGVRIDELRLGYRSPAQVLDLAARLLPATGADVQPSESVRRGRTEPALIEADDVPAAAAAEAARLAGEHGSVGVIAPDALVAPLQRALAAAGLDVAGELGHRVTVLAAPAARGLEFDAVVVVDPAAITASLPTPRGTRLLYVALTRPTRHLSVVGPHPLPDFCALRGDSPPVVHKSQVG